MHATEAGQTHHAGPLLLLLALGGLPWAGATGCIDFTLSKPAADEEGGTSGTWGDPNWGPCGPPEVSATPTVNEACRVDISPGLLDPEVLWSLETFSSFPESDQVVMAPVVGHLTDDNGDGLVGRGDVPDVVFVTDDATRGSSKHGILRVHAGADGSKVATIERPSNMSEQIFPYRYSNVALGDVDGDGQPEIVLLVEIITGGGGGGGGGSGTDTADPGGGGGGGGGPQDTGNPILPPPPEIDMSCSVAAFRVDGTAAWANTELRLACGGHAPSLADLDGDGKPEVVLGATVLNGEDGSLAWQGERDSGRYLAYDEIGLHSVVADLDGDGKQEVLAGRTIYEHDGTVRCQSAATADGFNGVADFDLDGQGDVLLVGNGMVSIHGADCATKASWTLSGGGTGGPPVITDVDADGVPEVGIVSASTYAVYRSDGRELWSQPVTDLSSHATGSIAFDFESDGLPEIVYADEISLMVFDGATGEQRLVDTRHASRTLHEYPTIADLDGDGSVDILVPNGGGHYSRTRAGVYALSSASKSWQAGRQVWNQHAYCVTNVNDDLSIPASPTPNWPTHNNFRSGDPNPSNGGLWPDATPAARVCLEECKDGQIVLDLAIANNGAGALRAGVPISAWSEVRGERRYLGVVWIDTTTEAGAVSTVARIRASVEDIGEGKVTIMADEDERGVNYAEECDEANNVTLKLDVLCP